METIWNEVIDTLESFGKTWDDVKFISKQDVGITKETFEEQARCSLMDYRLDRSLKVVGQDFWLEVTENDLAQWFEFKTIPGEPKRFSTREGILYENEYNSYRY